VKAIKEMMAACGFLDLQRVRPSKFFQRIDEQTARSFEQIFFGCK